MSPNLILRMAIVLVATLLMIIFNTCKKSEPEQDPPVPEVIIPETTRVISEEKWDNYFISADSTDWTLTMDPGITLVEGIKIGDVIVVSKGQGLLRKVTDIQAADGIVILSTEFASVCDAIQTGSMTFQQDLSMVMKEARIEYLMPGVSMHPVVKEGQENQISFSIEVPVHDHITITGELSLDPSIDGEVVIEDYSLVYIRMAFIMEEQFELTSTIDIASLNFEKEMEIAHVTFPTITVMVGVVPVLITPEFVLKLGVNVSVSSELTVGIIQQLSVTAGVEYENGEWSPITGLEKSFGHSGPELSNTLEAKAYIKPEISMLIYQVLSPTLSAELYGLMEADIAATPWWTLYAGLSADIGIKVKVWKLTLVNYNVNLFDHKIPIASAENPGNTKPTAAFTITPASGSIDTLFTFDASTSFDNEDPSSALEVRWDWEDDGSWDTGFSTDKVVTHQYAEGGKKTVRLEVRDSGELTDEKTLTVNVNWGSGGGGEPCPGIEEFEYQGRIYHTVLIGGVCWMKENLDVGTMIPGTQDASDNGIIEKYCYNNDPANCEIYGGLYQWDEMMQYITEEGTQGICPNGWSLPADDGWTFLIENLGGGTVAGGKMKSTSGWLSGGNGSNESGFTALPGSMRALTGSFGDLGEHAYFWSSTQNYEAYAWRRRLIYSNNFIYRDPVYKELGYSVRCVKN